MSSIIDRLVDINISIANFKIETAIGIGTDPGFVLNSRSLAAEIGQGNQITRTAFLTFGEIRVRFQDTTSTPTCVKSHYSNKSQYTTIKGYSQ
jgi:hypothetical protein